MKSVKTNVKHVKGWLDDCKQRWTGIKQNEITIRFKEYVQADPDKWSFTVHTHTHTHTHIYIYIYIFVCVCVCAGPSGRAV